MKTIWNLNKVQITQIIGSAMEILYKKFDNDIFKLDLKLVSAIF